VVSLGVLIYFIHHIAESIQVGHLIDVVSRELHAAVSRIFPAGMAKTGDDEEPPMLEGTDVTATQDGYLQTIDEQALTFLTEKSDVVLRLLHRPGDYIVCGMPLLVASVIIEEKYANQARAAFTLGRARTPHQDAVFAFLQLAEIAVRALSPGVNDPFTAVMCIDRITSAMSQLARRSLPQPVRRDASGRVRIIAYPYTYEDLVEAGYRHIREAARGQWQVCRHLRVQMEFVASQADDPRFRAAIREELVRLG
jgi:uncharacterized membrane protein